MGDAGAVFEMEGIYEILSFAGILILRFKIQALFLTFSIMSKHTISIFKRMSEKLPPLLPEETRAELRRALERLEGNLAAASEEVDNIVIALGKMVWPHWKAFNRFLEEYHGKLGEKFLLGKLSPALKQRYHELKERGVAYSDLRSGGPLAFFTSEEREIFAPLFVEIDREIRCHAEQAVLTGERRRYEELAADFQNILDEIEKRLDDLRLVADSEAENSALAEEIRSQVRAFEYGMCLLGPAVQPMAVLNAVDYFVERKLEKKFTRFI